MIDTFLQTLRLIISLWWLWLIIFGSAAWLLGVLGKNPWAALVSFLITALATAYLVLLPIEYLQIALPPPKPSSMVYPEDGGMPRAEKFEWDLITPLYEVINEPFIPLLKQGWYIWIPVWVIFLLVNGTNTKE